MTLQFLAIETNFNFFMKESMKLKWRNLKIEFIVNCKRARNKYCTDTTVHTLVSTSVYSRVQYASEQKDFTLYLVSTHQSNLN